MLMTLERAKPVVHNVDIGVLQVTHDAACATASPRLLLAGCGEHAAAENVERLPAACIADLEHEVAAGDPANPVPVRRRGRRRKERSEVEHSERLSLNSLR